MYFLYFTTMLLVIAFYTKAFVAYSIEDESKLQTDLLAGYNLNVRPSDQVQIRCGLEIRNILSLNIVDQTLAVTGFLWVVWYDHRLTWEEAEYGNVSKVFYRSDQIWRPTLVLQNSVTGIGVIGDNGNQKSIPMNVNSVGKVTWVAPAFFNSYCAVEVSKFPFDTQTCELVISGWIYTTNTAKLIHFNDEIIFNKYEENGEYDVIRSYTRVNSFPLHSVNVETLIFGVELKRKYSYYLVNVVLPAFVMQPLGLVVFVVPAESGEKLSFSLTLLLSLTVMMTSVAEIIPTTSSQTPLLSIYMVGGTVINSLELIMTVIILHFKHYDNECAEMPGRLQALASFLASLTCIKKNGIKNNTENNIIEHLKHSKLVTVDAITQAESFDNIASESTQTDEVHAVYDIKYTHEDISKMLDKASLFLFSFIKCVFTLTMLLMVMY